MNWIIERDEDGTPLRMRWAGDVPAPAKPRMSVMPQQSGAGFCGLVSTEEGEVITRCPHQHEFPADAQMCAEALRARMEGSR